MRDSSTASGFRVERCGAVASAVATSRSSSSFLRRIFSIFRANSSLTLCSSPFLKSSSSFLALALTASTSHFHAGMTRTTCSSRLRILPRMSLHSASTRRVARCSTASSSSNVGSRAFAAATSARETSRSSRSPASTLAASSSESSSDAWTSSNCSTSLRVSQSNTSVSRADWRMPRISARIRAISSRASASCFVSLFLSSSSSSTKFVRRLFSVESTRIIFAWSSTLPWEPLRSSMACSWALTILL
mmetsp:Transcript_2490/g.7469  ORF Transcript_2490/g.7469 Transcript_2490/m.7469 type:complete len:247 (+) Transcript_2490:114-854(+)